MQFKSEKTQEEVAPRILYSDRWWILISMVLLNFASRGHVTALASVTNKCAKYYDQTGDRIMMIFTISVLTTAVSWLLCSYSIEAFGLKRSMRLGGTMTFVGKSTLRIFDDCNVATFFNESEHFEMFHVVL